MKFLNILKLIYAYRYVGMVLFVLGFIWLFLDTRKSMIRYRQEADRWRTNYTILDSRYGEDVGVYEAKVQQMEFTYNELERQSSIQMEELRYQLRRAGIRIKDLEHALSFATKISDTLYISKIDTILINCLPNTVHLAFEDSLSKIDVFLNPDLTASAAYEVQASIYGFIHRKVVPAKNRNTGVGKFLTNTTIKYGATKWMVRKKVIYHTDIRSNNPNLQLFNVQSLRIIDN
jgi:hypothetical protein